MKKMVVILCIVVLGIVFLAMPVAAQTCGEDILRSACDFECEPCAANLNFKVTPTCDGLDLTWNDEGVDYAVIYYNYIENHWDAWIDEYTATSLSIPKDGLPAGTYSFAVFSINGNCYSNIVCDVEMPTTCTNTPEFPSIFLPAAMIIGFLGTVLLIQRTRKQ